ncbi:MAG TPA: hypothetical protein VFH78_06155 [Candidatus Thermoplasmatota archaeon]|nr:hypothetical protein [Candidatus Thermoplasmatota archaeon]
MDPTTWPTNPVTGGPVEPAPYASYAEEPARASWRDRIDYSRWSFYGALAGGVLILIAAFVAALFVTVVDALDRPLLDATWEDAMLIGLWGLVTGGAVVLAALRTRERPDTATVPGLVMITAGVLSFFALGGFFVGGLAAIIAGVLAVAGSRSVWRVPAPRVREVA